MNIELITQLIHNQQIVSAGIVSCSGDDITISIYFGGNGSRMQTRLEITGSRDDLAPVFAALKANPCYGHHWIV